MDGWLEQWQRVQRYMDRFTQITNGIEHERDTEYYHDDVYAFFQNCYHLKDWLKNDPASAKLTKDAEGWVTANTMLAICGDLANGKKHLRLTSKRHALDTKFGNKQYEIELTASIGGGQGNKPPRIVVKYSVESDGMTYDAYDDIAKGAYAAWEAYLMSKNLIP